MLRIPAPDEHNSEMIAVDTAHRRDDLPADRAYCRLQRATAADLKTTWEAMVPLDEKTLHRRLCPTALRSCERCSYEAEHPDAPAYVATLRWSATPEAVWPGRNAQRVPPKARHTPWIIIVRTRYAARQNRIVRSPSEYPISLCEQPGNPKK